MMSLLQTNPQLLASLGKGYRMMTLELRNIERLKELEVCEILFYSLSRVLDFNKKINLPILTQYVV